MTEGLFYDIFGQFGVFAAVRNIVFPTSTQEREKMKPIFSTEQARYQKLASFFRVPVSSSDVRKYHKTTPPSSAISASGNVSASQAHLPPTLTQGRLG